MKPDFAVWACELCGSSYLAWSSASRRPYPDENLQTERQELHEQHCPMREESAYDPALD